ncbi:hypothetical protein T4A_6517 [Trichinella pseudospiralis]|uniref:FLYWCH-type domain-containing protein n=1 Tax=Trichinella pseudospiralis TaxID=6337 RepID=A0A0V1EIM1_TRIPS|nr:hypothetical protein T4A_6517 [Trichinella pseudospiralis]
MANIPELRLVPNRCGGMSVVHEGRAYKLKRAGRKKYWRCSKDKKGCGSTIWTNLDVTSVIKRNDHIESCPVDEPIAYKMEKERFRRAIYILSFSVIQTGKVHDVQPPGKAIPETATTSSGPANPERSPTMNFCCGRVHRGCTTMISTTVYHPCLCGALIPVIQGYFPNTWVQGCYFCQAVHRKVGEPPLSFLYRKLIRVLACLKQALRVLYHYRDLFQYFQTNNHLEGWHNRLNKKRIKVISSFYKLLQQRLAEQDVMGTLLEQQEQVAQYTDEYSNGSRTLEQFLEA